MDIHLDKVNGIQPITNINNNNKQKKEEQSKAKKKKENKPDKSRKLDQYI